MTPAPDPCSPDPCSPCSAVTKRLPVFVGAVALGFGLTYAGGWPFRLLAAAAWITMLVEVSLAASRSMGLAARKFLLIDLIFWGLTPFLFRLAGLSAMAAMGLIWIFVLFLFYPPTRAGLARWLFSSAVQPYLLLGVFSFWHLRDLGLLWPFLALAIVVTADTGAYLVGTRFGRRRMAPSISPSKTVEGAVAGVLLSTITAVGLLHGRTPLPSAVLLGILLSALAVFGDLFESFLKRGLEIKDFGSTLPGHGGVFDRLDSLLAVSMGLGLFIALT